jgi:hypothetical protein
MCQHSIIVRVIPPTSFAVAFSGLAHTGIAEPQGLPQAGTMALASLG